MSTRSDTRDSRLVRAFQDEQMKVHVERINPGDDDRIKAIYEAHADTKDQQQCLKTMYVYASASDEPAYTIEKTAKWNEQWDTDAEALAVGLGYSLED